MDAGSNAWNRPLSEPTAINATASRRQWAQTGQVGGPLVLAICLRFGDQLFSVNHGHLFALNP